MTVPGPIRRNEEHANRPIIAFSERLGAITDHELRLERELGAEIRRVALWSVEEIVANAADADVIIVGAVEPLGASVLRSLPHCRLIVRRGVGYDNVDVAVASELGIPLAYVPDASVEEVSDHALALLLALERKVCALDRAVRDGNWSRDDPAALTAVRKDVRRLSTLTLGIVGFGRIGRALARKAQPLFGRRVASDPYLPRGPASDGDTRMVAFDELVRTADLISVHAPLTEETCHLIDRETLSRMKPTTLLVNTSRGKLVDEAALADALLEGRLAGAALDVNEQEPLNVASPLIALSNVLLTGHSAAHSAQATDELRRRSVEAAILALADKRPPALANPEVMERANCRIGRA